MRKIHKKIITIVICIIIASLFGGCIGSKKKTDVLEAEKITITMVTNRTELVDNKLEALMDEYMFLNPNIEIVLEGMRNPESLLKIRAAAKESADITLVPAASPSETLPVYYEPIDDLIEFKDYIYNSEYGLGNDGRVYSVTSGIVFNGIVYNKKSFEEAGIEKIPTTIEEFFQVCEKLKAVGITPFALNLASKWPVKNYSSDFVSSVQMSGDLNYCNTLINKPIFTDDGGLLKSLEFLIELRDRGYLEEDYVNTNWDSFKIKHAKGEVAMAFLGTWYPNQLLQHTENDGVMGMFPFPDSKIILRTSDWRFAISKDCENIEEVKSLYKWLFIDGNYARACDGIAPTESAIQENQFVSELLSFNLPIKDEASMSVEIGNILSEFKYEINDIFIEAMLSEDWHHVVDKYNELWINHLKENNE